MFRPLIAAAEQVTGVEYGTFPGSARDVSLRILAEHGRTMTFLVADGVVPSNEERGYVLRRIIRRAVRHAFLLGAEQLVTPALVDATVDVMGGAYPEIVKQHELVRSVVQPGGGALPPDAGAWARPARRRARARRRHRRRRVLPARHARVPDRPHARDRGRARARASTSTGFHALMQEQRTRAKEAHKAAGGKGEGAPLELYRELADELGPTDFTGRQEYETVGAKVRALVGWPRAAGAGRCRHRGERRARPHAVLRRVGWAGRRHRGDRDVDRCPGARRRHAVRPAGPGAAPRRGRGGHVAEGDEAVAAHRRSLAATPSAATTPPPTSSTGRCARCSART